MSQPIGKVKGKIAFDVMTTSIPRLMTVENMTQFLSAMQDRDSYHLRWLYHLDQYDKLEHNFDENLKQAKQMAKQFDEAHIFSSRKNLGFGGSVKRLMKKTKYDVLWIEDDYSWKRKFRLSDILAAMEKQESDYFSFVRQNIRTGCCSPSYWSRELIDWLLKHWPRK